MSHRLPHHSSAVADLPWGSHACCVFDTAGDLADTVQAFFGRAVEHRALCVWVHTHPAVREASVDALRARTPGAAASPLVQVVHAHEWCVKRRWRETLEHAITAGFAGLRVCAEMTPVVGDHGPCLAEYEQALEESSAGRHMRVLCTYALDDMRAADLLEVRALHQHAVCRRHGRWEPIGGRVHAPENDRQFQLLAEAIPHHVWTYLPDRSAGYFNQRLLDYTGFTAEQIAAGRWQALHPGDRARCETAWRDAREQGTSYEQEERLRGRDGQYRRFLCRAVPVRDSQGRLVQWFGTGTDIEEQRQMQEALAAAQAELLDVGRAATLGEEATQALQRIVRDVGRAGEAITHARGVLKGTERRDGPVDLRSSIREVLGILEPELRKQQIAARASFAENLPLVRGSRLELQQVVLNLVTNALEAMARIPPGRRQLDIVCEGRAADAVNGVRVTVQDTGIGFGPAALDRIFEPFYTTKARGLGLGLAISRSIVETHGGCLWGTSNDGPGATFGFEVPGLDDARPD
jgi:PAS domain S-box-containing protein